MSGGPVSHPEQVPPPVAVDADLLNFLNNTLGLTAFADALHTVATGLQIIALPAPLRDTSIPSTIWAPSNSAFANAAANTRGYAFNASDPHFLAALAAYHTVPAALSEGIYGPAAFHSLVPTALTGAFAGWTGLEDGRAQVLALQLGQAGAAAPVWYDQTIPPRTLRSVAYNQDVAVVVIDQVLGIPGQYAFEAADSGLGQFEALRVAAGADPFEGYNGFTAFAPAGNPGLLDEAQKRFDDQQDLLSLFHNHVVYGKTIYSSNFSSQTPYTSQSGFNYLFSSTQDGNWSVALNGVSTKVTKADVLVANGVIHILDDALWNLTPGGGASQASPTAPAPTQDTPNRSEPATLRISPGVIAGIVVAATMAAVLLCVAAIFMRKYYRSRGVRVLPREEGIDGPLTPPGRRRSPLDRESLEGVREAGSGIYRDHLPGAKKVMFMNRTYRADAVRRNALDIRTSSSIDGASQQSSAVDEEVVERLLHVLAQRIDGSSAPRRDTHRSLPPEYRAED